MPFLERVVSSLGLSRSEFGWQDLPIRLLKLGDLASEVVVFLAQSGQFLKLTTKSLGFLVFFSKPRQLLVFIPKLLNFFVFLAKFFEFLSGGDAGVDRFTPAATGRGQRDNYR